MSNPTIVTKLTSLFKGIFGRKEQVVTTPPDKKDESPATESVEREAVETVEAPKETPAAAEKPAEETVEKPAETPAEKPVEETAEEKPERKEGEEESEAEPTTDATEAAKLVEEPRTAPSTPATEDLPEDGPALAEELSAAEAHTTVASDQVLEKVRKEAAPAVEDLAVPTYDELTLPSIRARLRKLTIEQVRDLRAYEVAHQGRPEFIKMYDNRIAKLEAEA
ncbi:hypothetical protein [Nocardiopsis alkaliphila]|uniref:hypothetical protein n=1 Tax=Nocardiopsis alkaliphila TaxID=225762 RepID=UPI000349A2F0|nr:hypothetical protein [Nocardiopsis alkaliphila]